MDYYELQLTVQAMIWQVQQRVARRLPIGKSRTGRVKLRANHVRLVYYLNLGRNFELIIQPAEL